MALHALVLLCLALAVPTATFQVLSQPVGPAVIAAGGAAIYAQKRAHLRARPAAGD